MSCDGAGRGHVCKHVSDPEKETPTDRTPPFEIPHTFRLCFKWSPTSHVGTRSPVSHAASPSRRRRCRRLPRRRDPILRALHAIYRRRQLLIRWVPQPRHPHARLPLPISSVGLPVPAKAEFQVDYLRRKTRQGSKRPSELLYIYNYH